MEIKKNIKRIPYARKCYKHYARTTHFLFKGHIFKFIYIKNKLTRSNSVKLQIGGNIYLIKDKGWINGDILAGDIYLNANYKLPFPDHTVDYIFAEQFIEHISLNKAQQLLKEAGRVLTKGGVIRLATPDMTLLYKTYLDENDEVSIYDAMERHKRKHNPDVITPCHFFNDYFRYWGHQFIYDYETLSKILIEAGFTSVTRCRYGESEHEELSGRERHAEEYEWMKNAWQLIVEAKK